MKKGAAGGLAMLGAAILGGYYLLSRSQPQTIDLGSSGLGTGGNTSLTPAKPVIPGGESISSPGVNSPDSVEKGIEDADTPSTRGLTEVSDSGTYDTSADDIASLFGEIAPWAGLGIFQSASKRLLAKSASAVEGSLLSRIAGGVLGGALRTATKAIPVVGLGLFAGDAYDITKGIGAYAESINPGSVARVEDKMKGVGVQGVEGTLGGRAILGFGQAMSGLNVVISDTIAETVLGGPKPSETMTPTPSQEGYGSTKTVSAVDRVTSNYGMSDTPTLSKPYTGSTIGALNVIANTPVGTTWTNTGASQSKGQTTNTYQASSGQQVALAGISASDYAAYLANKK